MISIGLACILAIFFLDLNKWINRWVFVASFLLVLFAIYLVLRKLNRKVEVKKVARHNFDPMSLGTLHFGFALSLWMIWAKNNGVNLPTLIIAVIFSIASLTFFTAVYLKEVKTYLNKQGDPLIIILSFIALSYGFAYGIFDSLSSFPQISSANRIIVQGIVYFGFAWMVTILMVLFRDAKNQLISILIMIFFLFMAVWKFIHHDPIGGVSLMAVIVLAYLVAVDRLTLYGKVLEK